MKKWIWLLSELLVTMGQVLCVPMIPVSIDRSCTA